MMPLKPESLNLSRDRRQAGWFGFKMMVDLKTQAYRTALTGGITPPDAACPGTI